MHPQSDLGRISDHQSYLAHLSPKLRVQHCVRQLAYSATLCTGAERLAFAVIARAIMDAAGLVDCEKLELRQRVQGKAVTWLSQVWIDAAGNIDLEPEYIRQTMRAYGYAC